MKKLSLLLALIFFVAACSKDKKINVDGISTVDKDGFSANRIDKSELTGCSVARVVNSKSCPSEIEYLLVRTISKANGNNEFYAVPGFQFNYGSVKIRIGKENLEILPSSDYQFTSYYLKNALVDVNEPIVSFPIVKHFDIGRVKNDYGEETNVEAELEEGAWQNRRYIRVDWATPTAKGFKLNNNLWTDVLLGEREVQLTSPFVRHEDGSYSFDLESVLTSVFSTDSYTVDSKVSLVRVKDSDYQARHYSNEEADKFGIFRSFRYKIGMQSSLKDDDIEKFAMVYNLCAPTKENQGKSCASNQVVMHLSKGMPSDYIEMSEKAVAKWNQVFQEALGRNDNVIVLSSERVEIGDARKNQIAYVDTDFISGGLLGVSQSTPNPLTGEVLSSRSTVFGDGVEMTKGQLDRVLDQLITDPSALLDFLIDGKPRIAAEPEEETFPSDLVTIPGVDSKLLAIRGHHDVSHDSAIGKIHKQMALDAAYRNVDSGGYISRSRSLLDDSRSSFKNQVLSLDPVGQQDDRFITEAEAIFGLESILPQSFRKELSKDLISFQDIMLGAQNIQSSLKLNENGFKGSFSLHERKQRFLGENGIHNHDLVEEGLIHFVRKELLRLIRTGMGSDLGDEALVQELVAKLEKGELEAVIKTLKIDLAKGSSLREEMKREAAKNTFYTTLLHEMGHSFGLRHNFIASVDQENFHPNYHEIKKKLAEGDTNVSKLDLDAWAFSSVMDYNASFYTDLTELGAYDRAAITYAYNPAKKIEKSYMFCTDGGVADNFLCNRHDKGVNLAEITKNNIESYKRRYFSEFFRMDRKFFGSRVAGLMLRFAFPVRMTMDESIYQLVKAQAPAEEDAMRTGCMDAATAKSVLNDEFLVNVCKRSEFESFLANTKSKKTVLDLDSYEDAVNLNKPIEDFAPLSRADLAYSTRMAKKFFQEILGSPEPGVYLLEKSANEKVLTRVGEVGPSASASGDLTAWEDSVFRALAEMAEERGVSASEFIKANVGNLVDINPGPGKYYKSEYGVENEAHRLTVVGSIMEKYFAMLILSSRYLPVPKYAVESLNGNAYLWPHTEKYATELFSKMIKGDAYIDEIEYSTSGGEKGVAKIAAAQDYNIQNLATNISLLSFVTEQNKSFAGKMEMSDVPQNCETAKATAKNYTAIQVNGKQICAYGDEEKKDSITLGMLEELKGMQAEVLKQEKVIENTPAIEAQAKAVLEQLASEETPDADLQMLRSSMAQFPELDQAAKEILSREYILNFASLKEKALFAAIDSRAEGFQKANKFMDTFVYFIYFNVEGGIAKFLKRVEEISGKSVTLKVSKGQLEKEMSNRAKFAKLTSSVSDEELTLLAKIYLVLNNSYFQKIAAESGKFITVKAAPIYKQNALRKLQSGLAPIEEILFAKDVLKIN